MSHHSSCGGSDLERCPPVVEPAACREQAGSFPVAGGSSGSGRGEALVLDIGGEGRHPGAWNLNPSPVKTLGDGRGQPIPRHMAGRAEAIPLPAGSVDCVIAERTPLRAAALEEICRVLAPGGRVILRHALPPGIDPHQRAVEILGGRRRTTRVLLGRQWVQETVFQPAETPDGRPGT